MQAAWCSSHPYYSLPSSIPTKTSPTIWLKSPTKIQTVPLSRRASSTKAMAVVPENSTVDYSSNTSVFPAEACETLGGEACSADIYPEAKLKAEDKSTKKKTVQESVDREYMEYNEPKTVFPAEACDDLGGEFCQPEYQKGVY